MLKNRKLRLALIVGAVLLIPVLSFIVVYPAKQIANIKLSRNPIKLAAGEELAGKHCIGCHKLPQPSDLEPNTWLFVLAYMGLYLGHDKPYGLDVQQNDQFKKRLDLLTAIGAVPKQPLLSLDDWKKIQNYYLYEADEKDNSTPATAANTQFQIFRDLMPLKDRAVTMLHWDAPYIYIGYGLEPRLVRFDIKQALTTKSKPDETIQVLPTDSAPVRMYRRGDIYYTTLLGDILGSKIGKRPGAVIKLDPISFLSQPYLSKLYRTPQSIPWPGKEPGPELLAVTGFGVPGDGGFLLYYPGKEGRFDLQGSAIAPANETEARDIVEGFATQRLTSNSGSVSARYLDFNEDGRLDILHLQTDGDETLELYLNQGRNKQGIYKWQRRVLERFGSSTGFTGMKLVDLNGDKKPELIMTAGDNADSGPYNSRKSYHGVYVYSFDPKAADGEVLGLEYWLELPGAYGTEVADFDLDGKQDIAAISYFADVERPLDFVYMRGLGDFEYELLHVPNMPGRRFSVMTAGDFDGDGDKDIALGFSNVPYGQVIDGKTRGRQFSNHAPSIVWLINRARNP